MNRRTLAAVSIITGAGLVLRLLVFQQSLFGDELSTLYLVDGKNIGAVFSAVSSDAEISPPLYFLLAWLATNLADSAELVRLPALLAGVALIPSVYALGKRAAGSGAGLLSAANVATAPFMVFLSATGRAYSLMLLLLVGAALCLVRATDRGGWWWGAWALCAAAAMYSHYTAAFVLITQLLWGLWVHPASRRSLLLAAGAAAGIFLPWIVQLKADLDSPTNDLLQNLQGSGFAAKREAFAQWGFGHPVVGPDQLPGDAVWLAMGLAVFAAAGFAIVRHRDRLNQIGDWARENPVIVLVALAAVATPLGEVVLSLAGVDLLGARNLTASWPFVAIVVSFLVTRAGRVPAVCTGLVILAGLIYGAILTVSTYRLPDYQAAASEIESRAGTGDSVVDLLSPALTPVPLTPLEAALELPEGVRVYDVNQPLGEPPFLPLTPKADPDQLLEEAFRRSRDGTVFVVGPRAEVVEGDRARFRDGNLWLPAGWRVESSRSYPGLADLELYRVTR